MATEAQCGACGESNPSDSAFCLFCGVYLGWDEAGQGPSPAAPSSSGATRDETADAPAPAPAPADRPKGKAQRQGGSQQPNPSPAAPTAPTAQPQQRATQPATTRACPSCGHLNDAGRRFCGRCGFVLMAASAHTARPQTTQPPTRGWWFLRRDPGERAARRAYRRSLPLLYRWRRVLVALVVLLLLGGLASVTGRNPVSWAKGRWEAWTADLQEIPDVTATARPPRSVAPTFSAASATDGDPKTAWATRWPRSQVPASQCGGAAGIGSLELTWAVPTLVDAIEVRAGLHSKADTRNNLFQPTRIDVEIGGRCVTFPLDRKSGWQRTELDVEAEVQTVTVRVAQVSPNKAEPLIPNVAISEIRLLTKSE